jgi:hypothetical protein
LSLEIAHYRHYGGEKIAISALPLMSATEFQGQGHGISAQITRTLI